MPRPTRGKAVVANALSEDEWRFCVEVLRHGNRLRAFRTVFGRDRAPSYGDSRDAQIFANQPHVAAYLQEALEDLAARYAATAERTIEELAKIAFSNIANYVVIEGSGNARVDLSSMTAGEAAAIQDIEVTTRTIGGDDPDSDEPPMTETTVRIKLAPKTAALELLGKHFKLFGEQGADLVGGAEAAERIREARQKVRAAIQAGRERRDVDAEIINADE